MTDPNKTVLTDQPTAAMLLTAEQFHRTEYVYDEFKPLKLYAGIYHAMRAAAPRILPADPWHDAILTECMRIEGAYQKDDPVKTVASLIDWHVKAASEAKDQIEHLDVENHRLRQELKPAASEAGAVPPEVRAVLTMLDVPVVARIASHTGELLKPEQEPPQFETVIKLVRESDHRRACEKIIATLTAPPSQPEKQAAQDETYTDEHGTVWTRPTAEAYGRL